jgi:hypothetical protein
MEFSGNPILHRIPPRYLPSIPPRDNRIYNPVLTGLPLILSNPAPIGVPVGAECYAVYLGQHYRIRVSSDVT